MKGTIEVKVKGDERRIMEGERQRKEDVCVGVGKESL